VIYNLIFNQLLLGIIALLITYSIGKVIASFFDLSGNFFFRLFVTYIIGITVIVLFYSLIKTHGRSVNIILIPIICILLYHYRDSLKANQQLVKKGIVKDILWSLIPFLFIFIYQSLFYFDFANQTIKILWSDNYQFGFYSDSLTLFGTESRVPEMTYFFPFFRNIPTPYHFPELWFTSFFASLFNNASINSYYFFTYPILICCFTIGICSLLEHRIVNKWIVIIVALFLLFISGILLPFISISAHTSWGIMDAIGQKLAYIYCFVLLSFILLKNNNWFVGLIILMSLPIYSITFLPSIWGGIILFGSFSLFIKAKRKLYLQILLCTFTLCILYLGFYALFKTDMNKDIDFKSLFLSGIFKGTKAGNIIYNSKLVLSNFLIYSIPTIIIHISVILYLFIAYYILLIKSTIKQYKLFLLSLCIISCGAITTTLTRFLYNSNQFIESCSAFIIVFIVIIIAQFIFDVNTKPKIVSYTISLIIIYLIATSIPKKIQEKQSISGSCNSLSFLNSVLYNIDEPNPVILTFVSKTDCEKSIIYCTVPATNSEIFQLTQLSNKIFLFPIGNPELYKQYGILKYSDDISFYNLQTPINIWKNTGTNHDLKNFIEHFKIKYFYFKKAVEIPQFISERSEFSIKSPVTHGTFIRIK
jgi:hypothetical protein